MLLLAAGDTLAAGASAASVVTCTVFGMELSGGVEVYKVLDQRSLAVSPETIYTAPGVTTAFVKTITVVNTDVVARNFQFFRGGVASTNALTQIFTLYAGCSAVYEDAVGWMFLSSTGQVLTAYGVTSPFPVYGVSGSLAETFDRNSVTETNTAYAASGTLFMQAIYLTTGMRISNIGFHSATTAAGTPTHWMFGLYDTSRNLVATSTDQLTTAWPAQSLQILPMVTPYFVTTGGLFYISLFVTASSVPTLKGNTARVASQLAAQAPVIQGTSSTGLTTTLPNPAAAITATTASVWGYVS